MGLSTSSSVLDPTESDDVAKEDKEKRALNSESEPELPALPHFSALREINEAEEAEQSKTVEFLKADIEPLEASIAKSGHSGIRGG